MLGIDSDEPAAVPRCSPQVHVDLHISALITEQNYLSIVEVAAPPSKKFIQDIDMYLASILLLSSPLSAIITRSYPGQIQIRRLETAID